MNYFIIEENMRIDNQNYITYGISAKESQKTLGEFHDVSLDKSFVEHIAEMLNSCEIELCHFRDVIIDELNR